ncbi:hypothetical protein BRADO3924 [Bradyrhizobium sp. ORS 278]|nr:hypothetical protein BRADO3924 [Bradyrhizobium sp. ORS 278]
MHYGSRLFAGAAIAAGGLVICGSMLHHSEARDCDTRIELCPVSDAAYLPDEPAPEHAPQRLIRAQAVASVSTASLDWKAPFRTIMT